MKKVLLGTSALVAAGLMSTGAMAADPISLGMSGNMAMAFGYVSEDDGTVGGVAEPGLNDRNHSLAQSGEIHFKGSTTLDNGVKVSVVVELEAQSSGDEIDENFLRFSSDAWGTIELGGRDGAASKMLTLGPAVDYNHIIGAAEFIYVNSGGGDTGAFIYPVGRSSDSPKISYYTPRFNGFQIGVSYEPEPGLDSGTGVSGGGAVDTITNVATSGQISEVIEVGLGYVGNFGDVSFKGSFLYANGSQERVAQAADFLDDQTWWNVGAQIAFGSIAIGGTYNAAEVNNSVQTLRTGDDISYRVAISYSMGPWLFGAGYAVREKDDLNSTALKQDKSSVWGATAKRTIGPGVTVSAGVRLWDIQDDDNVQSAENTATNVFVATRVGF